MRTHNSERIRDYARDHIIGPARKRGEITVRIVAGDVLKALHLPNSLSQQACSALKTKGFLEDNHLALERKQGPPSMASTRVTYTFRLLDASGQASAEDDPLMRLMGIGREVFKSIGGLEAFIRHQREHFYDSGEDL